MAKRYRYRYMRTRANGKANETTSSKTFEDWFKEVEDGDEFFVAELRWVQCAQDGTVEFRTVNDVTTIPHVAKVGEADSVDNGRKA